MDAKFPAKLIMYLPLSQCEQINRWQHNGRNFGSLIFFIRIACCQIEKIYVRNKESRTIRLQFLVVRPNFWLSVLGIYYQVSFNYRFMVVRRTTASVFFGCPVTFVVVPGARKTKFRTLLRSSYTQTQLRPISI